MENIYLTDTTRDYYTKALAHIRNCNDDLWSLDPGLDQYIDLVNTNSKVRTMYSKRSKNIGTGLRSYLVICFIKEVEFKILNDIQLKLKVTFEAERWCELLSRYNLPKVEAKSQADNPFLKYIDDSNYWNINNIWFELKGGSSDNHDLFWKILSTELSKV